MFDNLVNEDCITFSKTIADNSIDLVIMDPPYFRVLKKEKWDKFKTFDEYVRWSEEYITALIPKIRLSGTLLLYGCSVNMQAMCAINNILTENGMYFVQEIIIDKGIKSMAGRISDKMKMLPPVSENIFVYRKDAKPFVKQLLKQKQKEMGFTSKEVKEKLGMPINGGANWTKYCGNTEFPLLPTREHWIKICELFNISIPYRNIEETYNSIFGLSNVWDDIDFYIKGRKHPSEKPLKLADRCVKIFSRENDLVYIPFTGGGNDIIACIENNRRWVATEINNEYIIDIIYPKLEKYKNN